MIINGNDIGNWEGRARFIAPFCDVARLKFGGTYRLSSHSTQDVVHVRRCDIDESIIAHRSITGVAAIPPEEFWEWVETEIAIDKIKGVEGA